MFIYYSGHGSPDPNTNKAYLVPIDCNPVMMSLTAYPLDVLYENITKIAVKSITVVLDACFSGGTNTGTWLVQNASPALLKSRRCPILYKETAWWEDTDSNDAHS